MKPKTLGERLSYALEDIGMSQKKLYERTNLSKNYISMIVKDKANPTDKVLNAICEELQINKEWLLTGSGEMYKPSPQVQEIADLIDTLLDWEPSEFRTKFIKQLASLPLEHWHLIEEFIDNFQKNKAGEE